MGTILIIEDDSSMLRGLKDNFEYSGYNVLTGAGRHRIYVAEKILEIINKQFSR